MLINKLGKSVYKILGADLSTKLAISPFGVLVFNLISPAKPGLQVYEADYGIKLKLTRDEAKTLGIVILGSVNPYESAVMQKELKSGGVFVDVGAYVDGWYSLLASKLVGKNGKVYSLEPVFTDRLQENITLNKLKNVTLDDYAISNKTGSATFYKELGNSSLVKGQAKGDEVRVKTITLDEYVLAKKIKKIDLVKIDVEGAEMLVLKGATKLLQGDDAPNLIVEVIDAQLKLGGSSEAKLLSFLKDFGYQPYFFTADGLQPYMGKANGFNLFFKKQKRKKS